MISEFGENANSYCSFERKETALLHSENDNLQQRVNALTHEVRGPPPPPKKEDRLIKVWEETELQRYVALGIETEEEESSRDEKPGTLKVTQLQHRSQ